MAKFNQLQRLMDIMHKLRDPENGCPWDLKQTIKSLVPYTLEEAYELAEAIENEDESEIIKELGDLLFHLVFYAQIGKEKQSFDFEKVAQSVSDKMIYRHPHVFAGHKYESQQQFEQDWIKRKRQQKQTELTLNKQALNKQNHKEQSLMDDVSIALPATTRAVKLQKQAASVGFDWDNSKDVFAKLKEEISELEDAMDSGVDDKSKISDELGDVFFSCINLSRHLKIDPEELIRQSNNKFIHRFKKMESKINFDHQKMQDMPIKDLEQIWQSSKKH